VSGPDFAPSAATREDVVREALSWQLTPFHDCSRVKGAGTDCLNLIIGVYSAVGLIEPFDPEPYSPQWFQHKDEPRFLQGLERYAHRVEKSLPGDVAMYCYGRHAAHSAIIVDECTVVHAWKPSGCVTKGSYLDLLPRLDSLWSLFP
jgi:cell wall-associated NlpC family hydrolase